MCHIYVGDSSVMIDSIRKLGKIILLGSFLGNVLVFSDVFSLNAQEVDLPPSCQGQLPTGKVRCNYRDAKRAGDNYVGDFLNGRPHGTGIYVYTSGDRYEGEFRNGLPNGKGTYIYKNDDRLEGTFKDGLIVSGKVIFANGDRY